MVRFGRALTLGVALLVSAPGWAVAQGAAGPPVVLPDLAADLAAAVRAASSAAGFTDLDAEGKAAAIELAIQGAVAQSGETDVAVIAAAIAGLVDAGLVTVQVALTAAAQISRPLALALARNPAITAAAATQGVNIRTFLATVRTDGFGLVGRAGPALAPYDACSGVTTDYC
jgi:hypothetical protein